MWTGQQLRHTRESLELSAQDLGVILGTSRENIYKWEGGTKPRSKAQMAKVTKWLKDSMSTNGTVKPAQDTSDYKEKYFSLLEKYNSLLEKLIK